MRITYDPQTDALTVEFSGGTVATSRDLGEGVIATFDASGLLVAVDFHGATRRLGVDTCARIAIDLSRLAG